MKNCLCRAVGVAMVGLGLTGVPGARAVTGLIDKDTLLGDQVSAVTTNGLLTVQASPRAFNNSSLNFGVVGGSNDFSVDTSSNGVETLDFVFDASVGMLSFKTAWTDGQIHLDGFNEDPQAYIVSDPGVSASPITIEPYDAANQRVVVIHPWQDLSFAEIGFSNVAASAGRTIQVYVGDTAIEAFSPQVGINEVAYTDPVSGSPVYTAGLDLISNQSASTDDGLVGITASPRDFGSGGEDPSWFGIVGGSNAQAVDNNEDGGTNAVPAEMIVFNFDESVGPLSFATTWTRAQIVWEGFTEDPQAFVITNPGTNITVFAYDSTNQRVVVNHPWQGGAISEIGFANPAAGAGQSLRFWVFDTNEANPQVAVVNVRYGTPPPRLVITSVSRADGGGGPELAFDWTSSSGEVFAVETTGVITGDWSVIETNIPATPPTNNYSVAADPDATFVRVSKEARGGSLFSDDLEAPDTETRWTQTASNGLAWEWGSPSPLAPPAVGPAAAHSGTQCYGTDLDGAYAILQQPSLRTPPIDLSGITQATLTFHHFRDIEESGSQTDPFQFDTGVLNVLRASDGSVIAADAFMTEGTSVEWEQVTVTLPASAMGEQVVLEFVLDADSFQSEDQGGWYIDDIEVTSP